tara:strand:- start:491 stop:637 length:147 start_codon:yes stop_codon:yes gene_type:complete
MEIANVLTLRIEKSIRPDEAPYKKRRYIDAIAPRGQPNRPIHRLNNEN